MDTNRYNVIPSDTRIFHNKDQDIDVLRVVKGIEEIQDTNICFAVETLKGMIAYVRIYGYQNGTFRVQMGKQTTIENKTLIELDPSLKLTSLTLKEEQETYRIYNGEESLLINKELFQLTLCNKNGEIVWELENTDKKSWCVTPCMGFRSSEGNLFPVVSFRIHNDEHLYGLGEKFNRIDKLQTRATIWGADTMGTNTTDLSYKAIPVLFSTKGWGMMCYTSYRTSWEIGSFSYSTTSIMVEDKFLDFFLFQGNDIKQVANNYYASTAKPQLPPKWSLGVWLSKCSYSTSEEVEEIVANVKETNMQVDAINIDTGWLKEGFYQTIGTDCCDFEWADDRLHNRKDLFQMLKKEGFHSSIWMNPYLAEHVNLYKEADELQYLVKDSNGGNARIESKEPAGLVDFSNPDAVAWWKSHVRKFLEDGVSCIKPDYADRTPETAIFFNGKTGKEMHNIYAHLYIKAVDEVTYEVHKEHILFRRAGYIGTNKYPVTWAGDTQTSWQALQCVMHGGISAGITGEAFWSHDIGGFTGPKPSDELYTRWSQFGMLSPISRFHGTTPREPWTFGKEAETNVLNSIKLRYRLLPYLYHTAVCTSETGNPIMKHLIFDFPNDPCVAHVEDQYMLGDALLVAPVLLPNARKRNVYFPNGKWLSYFHGTMLDGGKYHEVDAPLAEIPLYVKDGSILPQHDRDVKNTQELSESYQVLVFSQEVDAELTLFDDNGKFDMTVKHDDNCVNCTCKHTLKSISIDFVIPEGKELFVNGKAVQTLKNVIIKGIS